MTRALKEREEKGTSLLQVRIDKRTKEKAERLFDAMGMNPSTAVKLFYAQTINSNGLPFTPTVEVDPLYSKENLGRLLRSIEQMERGEGKKHDLIEP